MTIKYKVSYLSNGTKVKITGELFNQLKQWEMQSIHIPTRFKNELKIQDNDWLNSNRQYYRNNASLDLLIEKNVMFESNLGRKAVSIERIVFCRELIAIVFNILGNCTLTQKRRFIKYYICGFSYKEIAEHEHVSRWAVQRSVKKAVQMLTNCEQSRNSITF